MHPKTQHELSLNQAGLQRFPSWPSNPTHNMRDTLSPLWYISSQYWGFQESKRFLFSISKYIYFLSVCFLSDGVLMHPFLFSCFPQLPYNVIILIYLHKHIFVGMLLIYHHVCDGLLVILHHESIHWCVFSHLNYYWLLIAYLPGTLFSVLLESQWCICTWYKVKSFSL